MAHFALLNEQNTVINIAVVSDDKLVGIPQPVPQEVIDNRTFLKDVSGTWVQTFENAEFRFNYAQIGGKYDAANDAFIAQKPFASWVLDSSYKWQAPIAIPNDGKNYYWDESQLNWIKQEI